jgi:hypothetical protein
MGLKPGSQAAEVCYTLSIIPALAGGVCLAIQGNGNWIWSGFALGAGFGFGCSALLLLGFLKLSRHLRR